MKPKHWSFFLGYETLFVPDPTTPVRGLRALIVSLGLIACLIVSGCDQDVSSSNGTDSITPHPTKQLAESNEPVVKSEKIIHPETSKPTSTPTSKSNQLPYIDSTPHPASAVLTTPGIVPTATIVPATAVIPATATIPTPTVIPTAAIMATPTAIPTPVRPKVSGYLLKINGEYIRAGHVSLSVSNGYVMVHPMTDEDDSYPGMTEVTLGYYPNNATDVVSWRDVDTERGSIATVLMDKDREIIVSIGP